MEDDEKDSQQFTENSKKAWISHSGNSKNSSVQHTLTI